MREIKFRAKPTDTHLLWVYGNAVIQINGKAYLFEDTDGCAGVFDDGDTESSCYIVDGLLEVYPETVGQYTGIKSRDGKEIYEKDVVVCGQWTGIVLWHEAIAAFVLQFDFEDNAGVKPLGEWQDMEKVVGNIFDNPFPWMKGGEV